MCISLSSLLIGLVVARSQWVSRDSLCVRTDNEDNFSPTLGQMNHIEFSSI